MYYKGAVGKLLYLPPWLKVPFQKSAAVVAKIDQPPLGYVVVVVVGAAAAKNSWRDVDSVAARLAAEGADVEEDADALSAVVPPPLQSLVDNYYVRGRSLPQS